MSDGTTYRVTLDLSTTGSLDAGLERVGTRVTRVHEGLREVRETAKGMTETVGSAAESVGGFLESAAEKATSLAIGIGKVAAVGAIAVATYGVMGLNNELEQTQISLGAITQAQGFTKTFEGGFRAAGEQVAKMKQDVKTLPGDLGQLSNIMKMIAPVAATGGASLDDIRKLAGRTMLTAGILSVPQDVAAREMAGLLGGRAGSHNILGGRLGLVGDEAKKFNALGPEARLAKLNEELNKYSGAADKFGNSFVANWTTLKDNVKYALLGPATSPLFDHVKQTVVDINNYFDHHKEQVEELTHTVGARLAEGWDTVVGYAERLEPIVAKIVDHVAHMNPNEMIEKAKHAGEIVLGVKLAGMGITAAGTALPYVMKAGAAFGAGETAAGVGAAGAVGEGGALAGLGVVGGLGVAAAGIAAAALPAAGAVDDLTDSMNAYHDQAVGLSKDIATTGSDAWSRLGETFHPAIDGLHQFTDYLGVGLLQDVRAGANATSFFADALHSLVDNIEFMTQSMDDYYARMRFKESADTPGPVEDHTVGLDIFQGFHGIASQIQDEAKQRADAAKKANGIHVHGNIQINVEGAGDPSRVARLVMSEFQKLARNPTKSSGTPDYSAPR